MWGCREGVYKMGVSRGGVEDGLQENNNAPTRYTRHAFRGTRGGAKTATVGADETSGSAARTKTTIATRRLFRPARSTTTKIPAHFWVFLSRLFV